MTPSQFPQMGWIFWHPPSNRYADINLQSGPSVEYEGLFKQNECARLWRAGKVCHRVQSAARVPLCT